MLETDTLFFNGKEYPTRHINVPTLGTRLIATTCLSEVLLNEDGDYASLEAQHLDETILFYVDPPAFVLPNKQLSNLIYKSIQ